MFHYTYQRPVPLRIDATEILRELGRRPHLVLRVAVRGEAFPERALPPFARIDADGKRFDALFAETDDDQLGLRAYFATDVPWRGNLVVGYGSEVTAVIPLGREHPRPDVLDEARIRSRFHRVTLANPGAFRPAAS